MKEETIRLVEEGYLKIPKWLLDEVPNLDIRRNRGFEIWVNSERGRIMVGLARARQLINRRGRNDK